MRYEPSMSRTWFSCPYLVRQVHKSADAGAKRHLGCDQTECIFRNLAALVIVLQIIDNCIRQRF